MFVGIYDGRGEIFLVVNKLKGRVLKMGESQHEGFGKSGVDEVDSRDGDGRIWCDI